MNHFYFTSWPDHGVPQFATALISFIKKVRKHYSSDGPPMVVHCRSVMNATVAFYVHDVYPCFNLPFLQLNPDYWGGKARYINCEEDSNLLLHISKFPHIMHSY